jgi:hypothetical protein
MTFLIKKPAKTGDIVTIKLTTAEEIIARLEKDEANSIEVYRPLTLTYGPQGVGMTPWMITAEPDAYLTIEKRLVMAITPTMKQAADQYIQGTTGIKTVPNL